MRVIGLPLHLWTNEILKKIRDVCRGFIAIDKETTLRMEVFWAQILVKVGGCVRPSVINIEAGARSYELQVWWELPPWSSSSYSSK